jgi:hypothetical protein
MQMMCINILNIRVNNITNAGSINVGNTLLNPSLNQKTMGTTTNNGNQGSQVNKSLANDNDVVDKMSTDPLV